MEFTAAVRETVFEPVQSGHFRIRLASSPEDRLAIFRLRYEVFAVEAQNVQLLRNNGLETDVYDEFCDFLMVEDTENGKLVGTYRILPGTKAVKANGFYSENEFDLRTAEWNPEDVLELGRSCVAKAYRNGRVIQLLWEGLAAYLMHRPAKWLIGCASMPVPELHELNALVSWMKWKGTIVNRYGIKPHVTNRIYQLKQVDWLLSDREMFRLLPPLVKGYLSLGAVIEGEPAYDPVFDTVDFMIVMDVSRMSPRHLKRLSKGE